MSKHLRTSQMHFEINVSRPCFDGPFALFDSVTANYF